MRVGNSSSGLPVLNVDTSGLALLDLPSGFTLESASDLLVPGLVNPLVGALDALLTPLLASLGTDISGADIFAKRTPECDDATLRG